MPDPLGPRRGHPLLRPMIVLLLAASLLTERSNAAAPSPNAPDHPIVPGFERFFTGQRADAVRAGQLLLGDLKTKYALARLAAFLEDPLHVRPSGRMPGLLLTKPEARSLANYLLQGIPYEAPTPNLTYAYCEGDWDRLPDFDRITPLA